MQIITNAKYNKRRRSVLDAEKELFGILAEQILNDIRSEMDIVYKEAFGESTILSDNIFECLLKVWYNKNAYKFMFYG